ncbi:MAG: prepilin-type N-terminal cleavage/methylation domain-containing protein [Patescibacteria group bacterium]
MFKKTASGFTLVEVLIYIFIFILISGGALSLLFSLSDLFTQYKIRQALLTSGTVAMERMILEIREADSVVSAAADNLTLMNNSDTVRFRKNGSNLDLYRNDLLQSTLNTSVVEIVNLNFHSYTLNDIELVRIQLELRSTVGAESEDWTINSGAILRGAYDKSS